jgi:hypothetical protein
MNNDNIKIIKYADDTAVVGLIRDDDCINYLDGIEHVNNWCQSNFLDLNVTKTKEMIWDYRRKKAVFEPVMVDDKSVEIVDTYKYLGCTLDNKLKFNHHVNNQVKKANKRLYFIRILNKLQVDCDIITHFYNTAISPVLTYSIVAFFNILSDKLANELDRPRRICKKIIRSEPKITIVNNIDVHNYVNLSQKSYMIMYIHCIMRMYSSHMTHD